MTTKQKIIAIVSAAFGAAAAAGSTLLTPAQREWILSALSFFL